MHKLPNGVIIPTIEALNDALGDGNTEFAIRLAGGAISCKTIEKTARGYLVFNSIDGSKQRLTTAQLFNANYTNIGKAMKLGALVVSA